MPGVILIVLDQVDAAPALLASAARLADLSGGAALQALVTRTPPAATILPSEEVLTQRHESQIRAAEQDRAAALAQGCARWMQETGRTLQIFDVEGFAAETVSQHGAIADFVVIGQPETNAAGWQALHAALFETARPVLLVPDIRYRPFGECVAIAWRDDGRAVKAVLPALRLLTDAAQVHVLQGVRDRIVPPLPPVLQEHGIAAAMHALPVEGEFGSKLLQQAHSLGADLLVMGAFAHSPWREMILGGVTRFILEHTDLPVLLRH